ncbi:MAG: gliding motility protein GldL [Thermaurantimonas sp.]
MAKMYGFGASIVILGAMFKILHWTGADAMLIAGLTTEAVIFFFSAFEKPAPEYDWTLVYPELAGVEDFDSKNSNALVQQSGSITQELDLMLKEANIDEELIRSLGDGLRKFGDAASKLNETIDAASGTQQYNQQITLAAKHMESLNALYAVQLEGTASQMELQNALIEKLGSSIENTEKLSTELSELVNNMAALNRVYGGMLSAMGVNRS